jgi:hypothetical protein
MQSIHITESFLNNNMNFENVFFNNVFGNVSIDETLVIFAIIIFLYTNMYILGNYTYIVYTRLLLILEIVYLTIYSEKNFKICPEKSNKRFEINLTLLTVIAISEIGGFPAIPA